MLPLVRLPAVEWPADAEIVDLMRQALATADPEATAVPMMITPGTDAKALGRSPRRMPWGAGHDAQMMQRLCPTAMIFVPSVAGLSHNVKEHTEAGDLAAGAQVLANLILELAE